MNVILTPNEPDFYRKRSLPLGVRITFLALVLYSIIPNKLDPMPDLVIRFRVAKNQAIQGIEEVEIESKKCRTSSLEKLLYVEDPKSIISFQHACKFT
jgi:hypothetical protein